MGNDCDLHVFICISDFRDRTTVLFEQAPMLTGHTMYSVQAIPITRSNRREMTDDLRTGELI